MKAAASSLFVAAAVALPAAAFGQQPSSLPPLPAPPAPSAASSAAPVPTTSTSDTAGASSAAPASSAPAPSASPSPPPQAQAQPLPPPPPQSPAVSPSTAAGEWVYTDAYGWIWVPAGANSYEVGAQPYVYLYTPVYGWTWYVSPWGWGRYYVGPWVHRAWGTPHVWYGGRWVARPHFVARPVVVPHIHNAPPPRIVVRHR
jgi:hypothetical protein